MSDTAMPMPRTRVRPAQLSDLDVLADLFDQYRQFYDQAPDLPRASSFIAQRLQRGDSVILLAEAPRQQSLQDQQPQGFCQLYPSFCSIGAAPIQVLSDLFVHPEARRLGVGAALLQAAEAQGRALSLQHLELTTAHTNLRAQQLYASQGWVQDLVYRTYCRTLTAR